MDETKRLDVGKVLRRTFAVYKTGFRQFIGLSAISLVLVVCMTAFNVALAYSIILSLFILALTIAAIYFSIRANVGAYKLARSLTQGAGMTIKESYQSSKGLAGTYFVVALMYALITLVPLIGIAVSYTIVKNLVLKCLLIVLFGIPFAFLYTRYYLAIPSAVLSERLNGEFQSSKRLVKGDFWRVLILIILTYGVFMLISQLLTMWTEPVGTDLGLVILSLMIECLILVFTTPIGTIAAVHMYLDLNEIKNADTLRI